MPISVIAGLGNPGKEYCGSRHNVGFLTVDALAESVGAPWKMERKLEASLARAEISGRPVLLVKPMGYMNHSGRSLAAVARYHRLDPRQMVVVLDEIQLEIGRIKLSCRGSGGGHNGAADIIQAFGPEFIRLRIGIGGTRQPTENLANWVLGHFSATESTALAETLPDILNALHYLVEVGPEKAMNTINTRTTNQSNESNKQ